MVKVTILGCGSSTGVPEIGCDCAICEEAHKGGKNARLRASIMVEHEGKTIVIDCSSDFREQMLRERVNMIDAIVLTHEHFDHIGGLDDVRPFNYRGNKSIPCYASKTTAKEVRQIFPYVFSEEDQGSTRPQIDLVEIGEEAFTVCGLEFIPLPVMHGPFHVNGYRIGDFAYLTDYRTVSEETKEKMKGVKTLVVSGIRLAHEGDHPTHASIEQSMALAKELGVENVYYTHMIHLVDYHTTKLDFGQLCYDGMTLEF